MDIPQADTTGVSIRGGVNMATGQRGNTTLFRTQAQTGGTCGSFDFRTSMVQAFKELPGLFEALLSEVLSEMPMLVLCYASPTLCDLGKHFQALLNVAIQAKYAQCQQIQMAAMYGGLRLRGGQISQCLEEESNAGHSISEAMRTCHGSGGSLRRPDGGSGGQMDLVRETLQAAGASPESQALAKGFLGEVTLKSGDGGLQAQNEHPQAAMLARLEAHKAEADGALRAAVAELKATGTVRGSRRNRRHAQHDMTAIISSTGSCQVLCVSLNASTVLRVITPHDRESPEASSRARHEREFLSREDEKDQK
jgi:hypothetical protein